MPSRLLLCGRLVCAVQRIIELSQPWTLAFEALGYECSGASSSRKCHSGSLQQAMLHACALDARARLKDQGPSMLHCVSVVLQVQERAGPV